MYKRLMSLYTLVTGNAQHPPMMQPPVKSACSYLPAVLLHAGLAIASSAYADDNLKQSPLAQEGDEHSGTSSEATPTKPSLSPVKVVLPSTSVVGMPISSYITPTSASTIKTDTPLKDYPASIQVVPNELLKDRGVTRIDQVADTVSGVHAEANYGGNGGTFFNIRGFSESNGLRDGFRNYGYYAFRDVQNIDQVEIFKGPTGALYGGIDAIGGYINTVSKRPEQNDFGEMSATVGSYGMTRTTMDVNRVLNDDLSMRLNASAEHDSTFRDDTFSGQSLTGRVESIAPATGVTFASVKPDNATGNFTKVVQRIPVKIALDADQPLASRLRVGMSVEASIETQDRQDNDARKEVSLR
jgi:outer membrane receptor protein involved in Fe transport